MPEAERYRLLKQILKNGIASGTLTLERQEEIYDELSSILDAAIAGKIRHEIILGEIYGHEKDTR